MIFSDIKQIKGYIINLNSNEERFIISRKRLNDFGFENIERFIAYDDEDIIVDKLKDLDVDTKKFANAREAGCAVSHIKLLEEFLDTEDTHRLIFEDDIVIHSKFEEYLTQLRDVDPNKYDVIFLGGWAISYIFGNEKIIGLEQIQEFFNDDRIITNATNYETHAYLITRKFAETALKYYNNQSGYDPVIDRYYIDLIQNKKIKSGLLAFSPLTSDNLNEIKFRCKDHCGLFFQSNAYISSINGSIVSEIEISECNGEWIPYQSEYNIKYPYKFYDTQKQMFNRTYNVSESGILKLKNGIVGYYGNVFTEDKKFIADLSWFDNVKYRDFKQCVDLSKNFETFCDFKKLTKLDGKCLNLASHWSDWNIYHYLVDFSTKIEIFEKLMDVDINSYNYIYVPHNNYPLSYDIMSYLKIRPNKLISFNDDISKTYQFDEVHTVSLNGSGRISRRGSFEYLKRNIFKLTNKKAFRKIFIKRLPKNIINHRPLINEDELEKLVESYGFEIISPELLKNAAEYFNEASIVLGVHGAGLANCIFCQPGSTLIELMDENWQYPYYTALSDSNSMEYHAILSKYHSYIGKCEVDIPKVKKLLNQLL